MIEFIVNEIVDNRNLILVEAIYVLSLWANPQNWTSPLSTIWNFLPLIPIIGFELRPCCFYCSSRYKKPSPSFYVHCLFQFLQFGVWNSLEFKGEFEEPPILRLPKFWNPILEFSFLADMGSWVFCKSVIYTTDWGVFPSPMFFLVHVYIVVVIIL